MRRASQQEVPLAVGDGAAVSEDVGAQHQAEQQLVPLEEAPRHVSVRRHGGVLDQVSQVVLQIRAFPSVLDVRGENLATEGAKLTDGLVSWRRW